MDEYTQVWVETHEGEALRYLKNAERDCNNLIDLVCSTARSESGQKWRHHLPAIARVLIRLHEHCNAEIGNVDQWRDGILKPADVVEKIEEDCRQVNEWLCWVTGTQLHQPKRTETTR